MTGKKPGSATITVWDDESVLARIQVRIRPSNWKPAAARSGPGQSVAAQPITPAVAENPLGPALAAAPLQAIVGPVGGADPPLGPGVIARLYGGAVDLDPDLRPDVKFELVQYATIEVNCPDHKINHVKVAGEDVLLIRKQTDSGFRVSAKKVGTGKIALFDDAGQFGSVEIVVLAQPTAARPMRENYGPPPQPVAAPTVVAQAPESSEGNEVLPRIGAKSGQIDVASLGVAIIEARGEIDLAHNQAQIMRRALDRVPGSVNAGEFQAALIKLATAKKKLEFLIKIAQAAHDAAERELEFETIKLGRVERLREKKAISSTEVDTARREYAAAEDKIKLLEMIPDVKKTEKASPRPPAASE